MEKLLPVMTKLFPWGEAKKVVSDELTETYDPEHYWVFYFKGNRPLLWLFLSSMICSSSPWEGEKKQLLWCQMSSSIIITSSSQSQCFKITQNVAHLNFPGFDLPIKNDLSGNIGFRFSKICQKWTFLGIFSLAMLSETLFCHFQTTWLCVEQL